MRVMGNSSVASLAVFLCCWLMQPAEGQSQGLKVYISADMEGVGGAVTRQQVSRDGFEYERFRDLMTTEVNAAIESALEAGATEIVVSDSHGSGQNLLVDKLHPAAKLVRSFPRPQDMMQGIDGSFDAALFIGYHAGQGKPDAVLAHTMNSEVLWIKLNGVTVGEPGFNAALAGHFGVPVILIAGDQGAIGELRDLVGDVEGAEVKHAYGLTSALTLHPTQSRQVIAERTAAALGRLGDFKPYRVTTPISMEVAFKNTVTTEVVAMIPGVERTAPNAVRLTVPDMVEAAKFVVVLMYLQVANEG